MKRPADESEAERGCIMAFAVFVIVIAIGSAAVLLWRAADWLAE